MRRSSRRKRIPDHEKDTVCRARISRRFLYRLGKRPPAPAGCAREGLGIAVFPDRQRLARGDAQRRHRGGRTSAQSGFTVERRRQPAEKPQSRRELRGNGLLSAARHAESEVRRRKGIRGEELQPCPQHHSGRPHGRIRGERRQTDPRGVRQRHIQIQLARLPCLLRNTRLRPRGVPRRPRGDHSHRRIQGTFRLAGPEHEQD